MIAPGPSSVLAGSFAPSCPVPRLIVEPSTPNIPSQKIKRLPCDTLPQLVKLTGAVETRVPPFKLDMLGLDFGRLRRIRCLELAGGECSTLNPKPNCMTAFRPPAFASWLSSIGRRCRSAAEADAPSLSQSQQGTTLQN